MQKVEICKKGEKEVEKAQNKTVFGDASYIIIMEPQNGSILTKEIMYDE